MKDYLDIIVPAIISVVGFIVTYFMMKKEFRNTIDVSLHNDRKELYIEAYECMIDILQNDSKVFSNDYMNCLTHVWIKISIIANKKVYDEFKNFYQCIRNINDQYNTFCTENYWEKYDIDENGNKIQLFTQFDIDRYEWLVENYKKEKKPSKEILHNIIKAILKEMKEDLHTDK